MSPRPKYCRFLSRCVALILILSVFAPLSWSKKVQSIIVAVDIQVLLHDDRHELHHEAYPDSKNTKNSDTHAEHSHEHKHSPKDVPHNHKHRHNLGIVFLDGTVATLPSDDQQFPIYPKCSVLYIDSPLQCQGVLRRIFRPPIV